MFKLNKPYPHVTFVIEKKNLQILPFQSLEKDRNDISYYFNCSNDLELEIKYRDKERNIMDFILKNEHMMASECELTSLLIFEN